MRTFGCLLFGLLLLSPSLHAQNPPEWGQWQEAHTLYDSGKYDEALQFLRAHPEQDARYYFNLGTVYLRLDHLGNALAYLERARRMAPHEQAFQQNLKQAQSAWVQKFGEDHLDPASTWIETISDRLSLDEVRGTVGLFGLILCVLAFRAYLRTRSLRKTLTQPAVLIAVIAWGITGALYAAARSSEATPPAAIIESEVIRSGPGDQFLDLGRAEAGSKVRLLGQVADSTPVAAPSPEPSATPSPGTPAAPPPAAESWSQVRYSADGIGWIRTSSLLPL